MFVAALLALSRIVEPAYGGREFLRFLLLSLAGSGALTFVLVTVCYYIAAVAGAGSAKGDHAGDLLYLPICGFQGGLAALLVALKHIIPDNEVTVLGLLRFRVRHLAGLYLLGVAALGAAAGLTAKLLPLAAFGAYTAWLYLRFLQPRGDGGGAGDPSDDFRLATFFPEFAHPAVDAAAGACAALTRLGGGGGGGGAGPAAAAPGLPDDANTARRRCARQFMRVPWSLCTRRLLPGSSFGPTRPGQHAPAAPLALTFGFFVWLQCRKMLQGPRGAGAGGAAGAEGGARGGGGSARSAAPRAGGRAGGCGGRQGRRRLRTARAGRCALCVKRRI